jgi:lipopolysaccharide export LptBFGC system permease protein LptF
VEKGILPPALGVWWIHALALALGLYLLLRGSPPVFWRRAGPRRA